MRNLTIFIGIFLLVCFFIPAETNEVFAPFASKMKVAVKEPRVKITWQDSKDVEGSYLIYRHSEVISTATFAGAQLITTIEQGVGYFIDTPESAGKFYYAVLVQDTEGQTYDLFIPFRNTSAKPVTIATVATEQDLAAAIMDIEAAVRNDSIVVGFKASKKGRELIIYRSTKPITQAGDLLNATSLKTFRSEINAYTDYPVPGIPYYYAVIDTGLVQQGTLDFTEDENSTASSIEIPLGSYQITTRETATISTRSQPLPFLLVSNEIETGRQLSTSIPHGIPERVTLNPATSKALKQITRYLDYNGTNIMNPDILNIDRAAAEQGEEYTLKTILKGPFENGSWIETEKQLKNFLTIYLSSTIRTRCRYYLGQSYYFQGRYREAFLEFLAAENDFYAEVQPWLDAILGKLKNT
jgi:hypothetical protein